MTPGVDLPHGRTYAPCGNVNRGRTARTAGPWDTKE
jgi:hypothetical protein